MKKALSLIFFVILAIVLSATAFAADIIASGYCGAEGDGTHLEWKVDSKGVITISGEGPMIDYPYSHYPPWNKYDEEITEIIIEDGVTHIGRYAFYNSAGTKCTIGKDVASIGEQSFINCAVNEYYFTGDAPTVIPGNSPYLSFEVVKDILYYPEGNETWKVAYGIWKEFRAKSYVPAADVVYGDVDGNGKVNILDANIVRRYAAKLVEFDDRQLFAADVNGDEKVNILDANLIRRFTAKLIDKFPVES